MHCTLDLLTGGAGGRSEEEALQRDASRSGRMCLNSWRFPCRNSKRQEHCEVDERGQEHCEVDEGAPTHRLMYSMSSRRRLLVEDLGFKAAYSEENLGRCHTHRA